MLPIETYVLLLGIVIFIGVLFRTSIFPISLILVIVGMTLSLFFKFPHIDLNPEIVLDVFLPLLLYQISSFSSWKDVKKDLNPIALLSVGHVIFMTCLIACVIYLIIPQIGWPLAFVLGAVISPPDDVAIVTIAEKIRIPHRVVTILEGEGMFNDATALILFRFALAAVVTHQFSFFNALSTFIIVVIAEISYGLFLGFIMGKLRMHIQDPILHMITSILTPFIAYLPAERLGGCGVVATVVTGLMIGHHYSVKFAPDFRLLSRAVWPTLVFAIQSYLFLMVGLNLPFIIEGISSIPPRTLCFYGVTITTVVVLGRFLWVFPVAYLPRYLFPNFYKGQHPPWQQTFIVSWAGMRGSISLAAAMAVPILPANLNGANARDLILFLVFCVIVVTLVLQGMSLPWLLKKLDISKHTRHEKHIEHLSELAARIKITKAVIEWLKEYKEFVKTDPKLLDEVELYLKHYQLQRDQLKQRLHSHNHHQEHDEQLELIDTLYLLTQVINIERRELLRIWRQEKINDSVRNKLLDKLDYRSKYISEA